MKHQYFGDFNDYLKYGLLRAIQRKTQFRLGVCWMVTPDDGRSDGKFISYLNDRHRWRKYDPALFDALSEAVAERRNLDHVAGRNILPDAAFVNDIVPDSRFSRAVYFDSATRLLQDAELIFFDPDNGIEVASCALGRQDSSKYLFWHEIEATYDVGKSVLIYQHFPREERGQFVARIMNELRARTSGANVSCFRTPNVAFFLAAQPAHSEMLDAAAQRVEESWAGQIRLVT